MKKILALLGVMTLATTVSYASVEAETSASIETLRAQGYSESTLKVMDTVNYYNKGGDYQKKFTLRFKGPYYQIKNYVDPIQEDNMFGEHQINFSNSWNGDETRYTSKKKYIGTVEREGVEEVEDL